ncbi:MAG TPA: hypothetical protein DCQ98_16580 [Planctomycetaceae bacterium]|nr:hypothetical protein [Planctomycetaceae bacterium]
MTEEADIVADGGRFGMVAKRRRIQLFGQPGLGLTQRDARHPQSRFDVMAIELQRLVVEDPRLFEIAAPLGVRRDAEVERRRRSRLDIHAQPVFDQFVRHAARMRHCQVADRPEQPVTETRLLSGLALLELGDHVARIGSDHLRFGLARNQPAEEARTGLRGAAACRDQKSQNGDSPTLALHFRSLVVKVARMSGIAPRDASATAPDRSPFALLKIGTAALAP